ncbi:H-NS histone family protein [Azohydromonas caseinilytica]|uniref:H-NS histone family protein n=1 Tax=Azohydromonas caseinilytica TaxID=2728836 RepID=A0A848F7K9_9BURK|nr:H-NS histone family protein [Azohydromonas caseinilytica]NML14333.1 H-NS histone family protein [Azohydromonas caseinilytica]
MTTLQELLNQRAELERQIAETQRQERVEAIATIRQLMSDHGLTVEDLSSVRGGARAASNGEGKRGKVPAKYRNSATGESWTGRGLQPKWLKAALAEGKQLSDFLIAAA